MTPQANGIAETALFAMALAAALFAAGQLIFRGKTARNYFLATGVFCLSYVLSYFWAVQTGAIRRLPLLLYSNVTITFLVAPSIYLSFSIIIRNGDRRKRSCLPHFAPLPAAAAAMIAYNLIARPLEDGSGIPGQLSNPAIYAMSLASDLYMLAYMLAANLEASRRVKEGGAREAKRLGLFRAYLLGLLLSSIVTLAAYPAASEVLFAAGAACFGVVVIAYALYCSSAAGRDRTLWFGDGKARGKRIEDPEDDLLAARLDAAMERDKAFKDPELSVEALARSIGATSRQLSRLINDRTGANFRAFVNARRIEEIKADLVRHPERTILDIAIDNGFNSKTSFNTEFARSCGQSPRQYRKARLAEDGR